MRTILLILVAIGGCACGAGFWQDDPNGPTDLVHDQFGMSNNGSQYAVGNGPLFARRHDAGAADAAGE